MSQNTIKWFSSIDSLLIAKSNLKTLEKTKIAAFDLDSTLITTKSGRVFPKDEHDWRWWNPHVPNKLKQLNKEGYDVIIISNQNGLNSDKKVQGFQYKIETILKQIDSPILLLAALKKDKYRKPLEGMWEWIEKESAAELNKAECFYIGDAAGRQEGWQPKAKKDHSCSDRKFAHNVGIQFQTPDEYFLSQPKAPFKWGGFNAKEYNNKSLPLFLPDDTPLVSDKPEVIVCVGYPASGKTSFVKRYLSKYTYINQDTLKTKEKCVFACKQALDRHEFVVIDNTNMEASTRSIYVKLAKEAHVPVRCFHFGNNEELSQHNNQYRAIHKIKEKRPVISSMVFRLMKNKYEAPTHKEGFSEIKEINFKFEGDSTDKEAWEKWWF